MTNATAKTIEKIWGTTTGLILTPLFEVHRLQIKPRHRCSFHEHRTKHNAFYVLEGVLFIDSALSLNEKPEERKLTAGHTYTVAPGVWHQFRTEFQDCLALEMYFCEPLSEDIHRSNTGGPVS